MANPVVTSVTFDKTSYNKGDTITCTVKYTDSNTHGVTSGLGVLSPVGALIGVDSATPTITTEKTGDVVVLHLITQGNAPVTGITGGNCTWKQVGTTQTGTVNAGYSGSVWVGLVTAAGSTPATIATTGTPTSIRGGGQEYHSSTGQITFVTESLLDTSGSNTAPTLNPTAANQLYSVYCYSSNVSSAGATPGFTYDVDAHGNVLAYDANCPLAPQDPVFGNSTMTFGVAVLMSAPLSAGTFTPVGGIIQSQTATIPVNPQQVGDIIVMFTESEGSAPPVGITGGNCTWQQVGTTYNGQATGNAGTLEAVYVGIANATGLANATVAYNGTPTSVNNRGQEFYSSSGAYSFIAQAALDSAGTNQLPPLSPTGPGQLYAVSVLDASTFVAGTTPGYTYELDVNHNGLVYNPSCTSDPQAPLAGDSTCTFGIAVLLSAGGSTTPTPTPTPAASPLIASIATHAGVDPFGNPFPQGINAEKGSLAGTTLSVGNTLNVDQTGISVYNGAPVPSNLQLAITPQGGIVTKTPVVFNQFGGTPAADPGGGATAYSAHGDVEVVDGTDQQAYAVQRRTLATGADQPISSTTFATFLSSQVKAGSSAREYRVHGTLYVAPNQTGGKAAFRWTGPGATLGHVNMVYNTDNTTPSNSGALGNGVSSAGAISMTMVNGQEIDVEVDGVIQVPAGVSGSFTLDAAEGTAGDSFIVRQFSYVDVMPV